MILAKYVLYIYIYVRARIIKGLYLHHCHSPLNSLSSKMIKCYQVKSIGENPEWFSKCSSFNRCVKCDSSICFLYRGSRFENNFLSFKELDEALTVVVRCSWQNCWKALVQELHTNQAIISQHLVQLHLFNDVWGMIRIGLLRYWNLK